MFCVNSWKLTVIHEKWLCVNGETCACSLCYCVYIRKNVFYIYKSSRVSYPWGEAPLLSIEFCSDQKWRDVWLFVLIQENCSNIIGVIDSDKGNTSNCLLHDRTVFFISWHMCILISVYCEPLKRTCRKTSYYCPLLFSQSSELIVTYFKLFNLFHNLLSIQISKVQGCVNLKKVN